MIRVMATAVSATTCRRGVVLGVGERETLLHVRRIGEVGRRRSKGSEVAGHRVGRSRSQTCWSLCRRGTGRSLKHRSWCEVPTWWRGGGSSGRLRRCEVGTGVAGVHAVVSGGANMMKLRASIQARIGTIAASGGKAIIRAVVLAGALQCAFLDLRAGLLGTEL